MEYLDIIEENFTKSDYVAYLRGSILMWLLEDKPFDTAQFKLHADKLVEVLEEQSTDTTDDGCHCLQSPAPEPKKPTVDPDEPKVQPKHEFKLGDHVLISKGTEDERTGVIVRLPMDGVDCKNAWVASEKVMELLPTTLKTNTWYHTTDFTLEELSRLLPSGTRIQVEKQVIYDGIGTTPPTETRTTTVESVTTSFLTEEPLIETTSGTFLKEWFMLQGEK